MSFLAARSRSRGPTAPIRPLRHPSRGHGRVVTASDPAAAGVPTDISCRLLRNDAGVITEVDAAIVEVLGWRPEQMLGEPSTTFIHPEDQPSAVAAWFEMLGDAGATGVWRGRYRAADGSWRWVETANTNRLDDTDAPAVVSVMRRVAPDVAGVEEELRARKQLLSRLSDALPVGLFQIDLDHRITFTNDRLHAILGVPASATIEAQLAGVVAEDRGALDAAVTAVLADRPVDDVEVRFRAPDAECDPARVCLVSLRPLTDDVDAINGAIGVLSDVTDRVQLRRELEVRATTDSLTGCLNRAAILELLELLLERRSDDGGGVAAIFVDLDRFKDVNDRLGHAAGDSLLVESVRRLRGGLRSGDEVGRVGGDEFLVVCSAVSTPDEALEIAGRLAGELQAGVQVGGRALDLRASFGVAWSDRATSADRLIATADRAMYRAKLAGPGEVRLAV